ncbi:hypothetical protein BA059_16925 [Mycolicibacterium sp. (ex Dasyatis americana)]|nr:hypothetical protein BA059_16925 [Mycolicibacterium sp. (ex Dasyatis americana)]
MAWPIVDYSGEPHYKGTGDVLVPVTGTGVAHIFLREDGGIIGGVSGVMQGDPGTHAEIDPTINLTELAWNDPTPASASWTELQPGTTTDPQISQLNLTLHAGQPGVDGESVWDPTDLDPSPVAGRVPVVNSALDGFDLVDQKIPEVFYPGSVSNMPSGNANFTVASVAVPSRPWARRVRAFGHQVVSGEASDVRYDLIARLDNESGGNIIARCHGVAQTERLQLSPGRAAGLADAYDQIPANTAATVYIRCERQAGTSTATSSASQALFSVETLPL